MPNYHFAWLGSKRAQKNHVGEKGWRLDIAARRGLPVPNGGILLDDFYQLCLGENALVEASNKVVIPNAADFYKLLYKAVRFPRLEVPCAIRSLFTATARSTLDVAMNDPVALAEALAGLWTAVLPAGPDIRRDVLIQEMVAVDVAGTAVTHQQAQFDLMTTGETNLALPQLGRWGKTEATVPAYAQRLQKLLAGVRRTFGRGDWQISWLDDGRICWLIQVEAISQIDKQPL